MERNYKRIIEKVNEQNTPGFAREYFLCGDEESGHYACIDVHLTTAYNPGMRLMPLPVIVKAPCKDTIKRV